MSGVHADDATVGPPAAQVAATPAADHAAAMAAPWRTGVAACALLAAVNLLAGVVGGLVRFGLPLPAAAAGAFSEHGAVLVCGVLGTLIGLQHALALRRLPALAAPLAAGTGGLLAWALPLPLLAGSLWLAAGAVLLGLHGLAARARTWSLPLAVEMAAALAWMLGSACWLAGQRLLALFGWMAFLVLTIAAGRRARMRVTRLSGPARQAFVVLLVAAGAALLLALSRAAPFTAQGLWWAACTALALWLLAFDPAMRLLGRPGWTGHTALCLVVGYGWLLVAGLMGLGSVAGVLQHHVAATGLHAMLLGFVFAVLFGLAPFVLQRLAGVRPVHTAVARWPVWLLSASLLLRVAATAWPLDRGLLTAGAGHALAIALFVAVMAHAVWRARR